MSLSIHLVKRRNAKFGNRAKECSAISANVIATCFALVGFTASLIVGWAAGNSAFTILWRSAVAFIVCNIVGKIIGSIAQRTIDDNIETYKRENPIPPDPVAERASLAAMGNVDIIEDESETDQALETKEPVTSRSAA